MKITEVQFDSLQDLAKELDAFHPRLDGWYFRGQGRTYTPINASLTTAKYFNFNNGA